MMFVHALVMNATLQYRPVEVRYAAHHMLINREHKLLYCAVPKVACTEFMRLFMRLQNSKGRWQSDPHFRTDKPLFSQLPSNEATSIINDPTWTKFVFFRDPAQRLLSAFVDKFEKGARYGESYATRIFKRRHLNFSEFVDVIAQPKMGPVKRSDHDGLHPWTNAHWRPQRFMCNLEKFLPAYDFVGSFDKLREHTELLLRSKGLWDEYGASGWVSTTTAMRRRPPPDAGGAIFDKNLAAHRQKNTEPSSYWTPELLAKAKRAYKLDYDMFDAIGLRFDGDPVNGTPWAQTRSADHLFCKMAREFAPC